MRPAAPMEPAGKGGCTGHSKRTRELCDAWAISGLDKCPAHAGKSRSKAIAEGALRTAVLHWGLGDVCADPGEVLLRLVTQSAVRAEAYAAELEQLVAEQPNLRDALIGQAWGEFGPVGEYVRGLVRLEAEERDRCAGFATKAIAAGLAERQVRLAERQGALLAGAVQAILADLGLSAEQQALVPTIVPMHLRAITAGAA